MKKILTSLMAVCVIASSSFAITSLQWGYSYGLFENDVYMAADPLYIFKVEKNITDLGWRGFNATMNTVNWDGMIGLMTGLPVRITLAVNDTENISPMSNFSLSTNIRQNGTNFANSTIAGNLTLDNSQRNIKLVASLINSDAMKLGISYELIMNMNNRSGTLDNLGAQQGNLVSNALATNNGTIWNTLTLGYNPGNRQSTNTITHILTPAVKMGDMQIYIPISYRLVENATIGSYGETNVFPTNTITTPVASNQNWVNNTSVNYFGLGAATRMTLAKDIGLKLYASLNAALGMRFNGATAINSGRRDYVPAVGYTSNVTVSNVTYQDGYMALPLSTSNCLYMNTRIADNKIKLGAGLGLEATYTPESYVQSTTNFTLMGSNGYSYQLQTPTANTTSMNVQTIAGSIFVPAAVQIDCTEWLAIRAGIQPRFAYSYSSTTSTSVPNKITSTLITNGVTTTTTNFGAGNETASTNVAGLASWTTGVAYSVGLTFTVSKDFTIDMQYVNTGTVVATDIWSLGNWSIQASMRF
ncbi:MAG: hypothetical protein AABZ39_01780 [Spirochaetota bacterium]